MHLYFSNVELSPIKAPGQTAHMTNPVSDTLMPVLGFFPLHHSESSSYRNGLRPEPLLLQKKIYKYQMHLYKYKINTSVELFKSQYYGFHMNYLVNQAACRNLKASRLGLDSLGHWPPLLHCRSLLSRKSLAASCNSPFILLCG